MEAMAMPFSVNDVKELDNLAPGTTIEFTLIVDEKSSHVEGVKIRPFESLAQEPSQARRLTLLQKVMQPESVAALVVPGQFVPDFTLIDQNQRKISLHDFSGKVVALDFVYTRCPLRLLLPFFQYLWAFTETVLRPFGTGAVLLTVTFDPIHDGPEKLATYAKTWKANPEVWHFLTGPPEDVRRVCSWFGMEFWTDEALLTHTLHTVVIDRHGKLLTNIEGNQYSAEQLGDLLENTMDDNGK